MAKSSELGEFLRRNPFASHAFLETLYGKDVLRLMLEEEGAGLRCVEVAGSGRCYADTNEPLGTLLDLRRAEMARGYALAVMGRGAAFASVAPGFEADGEFFWNDHWMRLWVDPGGCAVEALGFIRNPPKHFGEEVRDVVVTTIPNRLDTLAKQVEFNWGGGGKVHVMLAGTNRYRVARPGQKVSVTRPWTPYGAQDIGGHVRLRQRVSHRRNLLGEIARGLGRPDWAVLVEVGNIPLLSRYELAYLASDDAGRVEEHLKQIQRLETAGLVEVAGVRGNGDGSRQRLVVSRLGLEMLTAYWGTSATYVRWMHPWPQAVDKQSGRTEYSLGWMECFGAHYEVVRQFALALVYGARCVTSAIGGAEVRVVTTIGSRLLYRASREKGEKRKAGVVAPDGMVLVRMYQRGWMDGAATEVEKPVCERMLWLEVDRGTIPSGRLALKLDGYGRIWDSLSNMKPALVWVIDGTPHRETQILGMMKERGIDGWTVTMDRLRLSEKDPWWVINAPAERSGSSIRVGLRYASIGGMAPWRGIWGSIAGGGSSPLLGHEPWRNREMHRTPPKKGEQAWIKYKVG